MEVKKLRKPQFPLNAGDIVLGVDVGLRDLAFCRMRVVNRERYPFERVGWCMLDLKTTKLSDACDTLVSELKELKEKISACRYVVIEQQPPTISRAGNTANVVISYCLQTAVLAICEPAPQIVFTSSAAKFFVFEQLGFPLLYPCKPKPEQYEALTAYGKKKKRKETSVALCTALLEAIDDGKGLETLKALPKSDKDDYTDAFVYATGFIYKNYRAG